MDKIVKAAPLDDYKIEISTSSGVSGIFDVKPYLKGGAFRELIDVSYFKSVRPTHHGISWPHEQDFSSDTIIWDIQNTRQPA
ncbi:MAG: DUF2442 domain-containing protein [Candidatus Thiosymbion ectosymbiont of Robbea hypermnestra]|nr:DUF2442 domain-containing protein [Candidatus Thiosymbion ectosymbiont of Robbea hypermnestra]